jgi:hypothetical protein
MSVVQLVLLILMLAVPGAFAVSAVRTASGKERMRLPDRVAVVTRAVDSTALLVIGRAVLPWHELPVAVWGLTAFGLLTSAFAVRDLLLARTGGRAGVRVAGGAGNAVVGVAVAVLFAL